MARHQKKFSTLALAVVLLVCSVVAAIKKDGDLCSDNGSTSCCGEVGNVDFRCASTGDIISNIGLVNVDNIVLNVPLCNAPCSTGSTCIALIQPNGVGGLKSTPYCCPTTRGQTLQCTNGNTTQTINCNNYTGDDYIYDDDDSVEKGSCCNANCFSSN